MIFDIDPNSPKPIYQQIVDQVRYALATGNLREGDRLPPIRDVATQARVNRNTIAKAYTELEREGVIRSRQGLGSFISAEGPSHGRGRSREILRDRIDDLLALAHSFRMSEQELQALIEERIRRMMPPDRPTQDS